MQHFAFVTSLLFCAGAAIAQNQSPQPSSPPEDMQFISGGVPIRVQWYRSSNPGPSPTVLLLHGADGMRRSPELYPQYANMLAERGFHVMIVRYFDRTKTEFAYFPEMLQNFTAWASTVSDAVAWASQQRGVDHDRIGLLGISLGSSLALYTGTQDPRIKCVVEFFGAFPQPAMAMATRFPPVLVLHGDQDPIVPVAAAYAIEKFLDARKATYEAKIYAGQGHGFHGSAQIDAGQRAVSFFTRYLGGAV